MEAGGGNSKTFAQKKLNRISKTCSVVSSILTKGPNSSEADTTLLRIQQMELATFCPKKLFYIFLVVENDDKSNLLLNDLTETNKDYEEVSALTFVSRNDVFELLDSAENCDFPNHLKPHLLKVIENIVENKAKNIPLILELQLLKLKLIQVMYQQYINQVKINEKEKHLETLLSTLSKECKKKQKKDEHSKDEEDEKKKSPQKDDPKNAKKNKKDTDKDEEIDYTSIPIEKNDVSYGENIFDYIWFYCITGYYDASIVKNLIDQVNVPVCGVIQFSENNETVHDQYGVFKLFWDQIKQYFCQNTTLYKSLENTIMMQFTPLDSAREKVLNMLEDFVSMLRRVVNLKLTYLNYLRHLKINRPRYTYTVVPLECLRRYNKTLQYIRSEFISTELILDAILKEVCFKFDPETISDTLSLNTSYSDKSVHCINPLHDFYAFAKIKTKESVLSGLNAEGFLVHENNQLIKVLKSCRVIGPKIAETTLDILKCMPIFYGLQNYNETVTEEIDHLHDICPSDDSEPKCDETLDYFMYIFLFNMFTSNIKVPESSSDNSLLANLKAFDILQFWEKAQPKLDVDAIESEENLYDTSLVHFRWKEDLCRDLILQEIYTASNEFLFVDQKYSPETNNFLIVYSNKLDDFGINAQIFDAVVHTPICFRDFCRYFLVKDLDWLQEHTIRIDESTFKVKFDENCPGVQKVKTQLCLFDEYAYLLDGNIKEDIEENPIEENVSDDNVVKCFQALSFSDMFTDLKLCSLNLNIIKECGQAIGEKDILAFDLGSNICKVTGKLTTFCSHDNVKVTVDNTGFLQFSDKCIFNVISDGYNLIVHSRPPLLTEPYIIMLELKDSSRISFVINRKKVEQVSNCEIRNNIIHNENEKIPENYVESFDNESQKTESEHFVHCVDEDYIKDLLEVNSLDELLLQENQEDFLECLLSARENNAVIYKVNTKSNFLKRNNNSLKVPLESAFKNIISFDNILYKEQKHHKIYTKRYECLQGGKSDLEVKHPIDFRICLPNGLFIRGHPCAINKDVLMIKQEYIEEKPPVSAIQHEEFRIFSSQGLVLIKKVDGTITILKANGDIICFEKLSDGSGENDTAKPCHCATLNDLRKKLNKLLKDQEECDFRASRRGHITSKQNHILDEKIYRVLEQFDVPFTKTTITRFDGKRIKMQGDKITQKQLFHLTSLQDFSTGEIFFERDDNFRSVFDRYGSQKYIFPDGTIISNSIDVDDELVYGFVNVKLSYRYEHLYYATVKYNFDQTVQMRLNDGVTIKENIDRTGFCVEMGQTISTTVSDENILFQKTCPECTGQFQAKFDIKPFKNGFWKTNEKFMLVKDSYDKCFTSDFMGNCTRNNDYTRGRTNSLKCNHFVKTRNKKLFVINKDLTGYTFLTNDVVKTKMAEMKKNPDAFVDTYTLSSNENITVVDCRQKFYVSYADRFYNNSIRDTRFQELNNQRSEYYTTFRVFHKMFHSVDNIAKHISNVKQIFFNDFLNDSILYNNISIFTSALQLYYENCQHELLAEEKEYNEKKEKQFADQEKRKTVCNCAKETLTMEEKIAKWRKCCDTLREKIRHGKVPVYFKSEFCLKDK